MLFNINHDHYFPNVRLIGFCNYFKDWIHFPRVKDEFVFYFVVDGHLYIEEDGTKHHLKQGDFFLLEPNKHHVGYKKAKCKYYYIHINQDDYLSPITEDKKQLYQNLKLSRKNTLASDPHFKNTQPWMSHMIIPKHFSIKNKSVSMNISNILQGAVDDFYSKYDNYKLLASSCFLEVLVLVSREFVSSLYMNDSTYETSIKVVVTLNKLINFIKENYHKKLKIDIIEEYMELNYDYLNELLKKKYNITIGKMIQNTRIEAAKKMIRETDLNFSEIGYLVGINDPYYFSKLFKNVAGVTPTKYANQCKYEMQESIKI